MSLKSSVDKYIPLRGLALIILGALSIVYAGKLAGLGQREPASTPTDLSWKSWKKALLETKDAIGNKNLMMLAASIAYGGTLAFFPLVVACVAIASIVIQPEQINQVVDGIATYMPADIAGLLTAQLTNALDNESANVLVAVVAISLALFGVSGAMSALVGALNISYERTESRGIVKSRFVSFVLTCMMVVGMLIILPLITLGSDLLRSWGVPDVLVSIFSVGRWLLLAALMTFGLSIVYRYAPDRPNARWQWVSWGAIMATVLWLLVTVAFFVYVQYFSNFSQSYSLFAGIVVLMMWLNYSGLVVLIGAEVNHQLEKRTMLTTE